MKLGKGRDKNLDREPRLVGGCFCPLEARFLRVDPYAEGERILIALVA